MDSKKYIYSWRQLNIQYKTNKILQTHFESTTFISHIVYYITNNYIILKIFPDLSYNNIYGS